MSAASGAWPTAGGPSWATGGTRSTKAVCSGPRFRELEAQGRERIAYHIGELRESLRGLETESAAIEERVEARVLELTGTRTEDVWQSIEKSILDLRQRKRALREKQTFVLDAIRHTDTILKSQEDQFTRYSRWIRKVLDRNGDGRKLGIPGLISRLLLMNSEMKLALSGVDLKEPVRVAFAFAPPAGLALRSPPSWRLAPGRLARWRAASFRPRGAGRAALARFESGMGSGIRLGKKKQPRTRSCFPDFRSPGRTRTSDPVVNSQAESLSLVSRGAFSRSAPRSSRKRSHVNAGLSILIRILLTFLLTLFISWISFSLGSSCAIGHSISGSYHTEAAM